MSQTTRRSELASVVRLRAWKLALAGPSVYWYFPIFFVLLSTNSSRVNPYGTAALFVVMMVSASWGFILNDFMDREADAKSGRADDIHGHGLSASTMKMLIISTAVISWAVVFFIGGGVVFKVVLAINYAFGAAYSIPPLKLKVRRFWGFFANSVMERPLPILVFLTYLNYYTIWTIVLPILMEACWSVFKHQAADVREDTEAGVTTFAVHLGERLSMRIVNYFLNPLSFFSLLFLTGISILYTPNLQTPLAICFALTLIGSFAALVGEHAGRLKTYITPTDPPYIMFLNLSYRFLLLPVLAYGAVSMRAEYFPLIIILAGTLAYHAFAYSKAIRHILR
ncbi:MAG TPA: UbiA family prenyltransferase [Nitrososphaerales archaeon]|nr:UbiA family prenyltransferase [Nitrososphaerales archaeon]